MVFYFRVAVVCLAILPGISLADCQNKNCLSGKCDHENGTCTIGCEDGWWGVDCKLKCPQRCEACDRKKEVCTVCQSKWSGSDCSIPCSGRCKRQTCNIIGFCQEGCEVGFYGRFCEKSYPGSVKLSQTPNARIPDIVVMTAVVILFAVMALYGMRKHCLGCKNIRKCTRRQHDGMIHHSIEMATISSNTGSIFRNMYENSGLNFNNPYYRSHDQSSESSQCHSVTYDTLPRDDDYRAEAGAPPLPQFPAYYSASRNEDLESNLDLSTGSLENGSYRKLCVDISNQSFPPLWSDA